jgi:hypothetical protein
LAGLGFNHYPPSDEVIRDEALRIFHDRLAELGRPGALVEMPVVDLEHLSDIDFSPIFH